jgi:hypothetical protein
VAGYNPYVIVETVDNLRKLGAGYVLLAALVGGLQGWATMPTMVGIVVGVLLGLAIGYFGWLLLNALAQIMLCLAKIEQNTRPEDERREIEKHLAQTGG